MPTPHHSFFTGRMPFLPPNQQRQSTEGTKTRQTKQIGRGNVAKITYFPPLGNSCAIRNNFCIISAAD